MSEQGSEAWLAERRGKITCSRFADVVDRLKSGERSANGKRYLLQVAIERIAGRSTPVFETWQMRQGTEREPAARAIYEHLNGVGVQQVGFLMHDEYSFVGGSPDGVCNLGSETTATGTLEIKCPELEQHLENLYAVDAGVLPDKYRAQVQGLMWVTGADWCDWISFNPDFPPHLEFACLRVNRDEEYIALLEGAVCNFQAEVCALCDRMLAMNGGPQPAPVRLRDLEVGGLDAACISEWLHVGDQITDGVLNDDFDPTSWMYQRSELHVNGDGYHVFRRESDGAVEVARASEEWVAANRE